MDKDNQVFQAAFRYCVGDDVEVLARTSYAANLEWHEARIKNIFLSGCVLDGFKAVFAVTIGGVEFYPVHADSIRPAGSQELKAALAAMTKERDELLVRVKKADDRTYARSLELEAAVADKQRVIDCMRENEIADKRTIENEIANTQRVKVELQKEREARSEEREASTREIVRRRNESDNLYKQLGDTQVELRNARAELERVTAKNEFVVICQMDEPSGCMINIREPVFTKQFKAGDRIRVSPWSHGCGLRPGSAMITKLDVDAGVLYVDASVTAAIPAASSGDWIFVERPIKVDK